MSPILKNIVSPLQMWLLSQNRCVGCGTPLTKAKKILGKTGTTLVCKCKRMYRYDPENKSYRRALVSEVD